MKSIQLAVVVALAVTTCPAAAAAQTATAESPHEVTFSPQIIDRENHCIVGFSVTYPKEVAPHSRHIRITTLWSEASQDNPWPIPSLGAPDSFTHNEDGTVTFSGAVNESIGGCDPELTARTLAIGPCAEDKCPPARFVPDEAAASLGLHEAEY